MSTSGESRYVPALGFHWLTPFYDIVVRLTTREKEFKSALIEQARIEPGQEVLDLACGTGTLAIMAKIRHPQAQLTGIDGDQNILAIADSKAKQADCAIHFVHGLSFSLPFSTERFDCILSSLFFHHLSWSDKQRTAGELYRVLRPGGVLHVADWGRATGILMRGTFFVVQLLDGFKNTQDNVNGKLIELFQQAGFSDVSEERSFSTLFGTLSLYRAAKADSPPSNPPAP